MLQLATDKKYRNKLKFSFRLRYMSSKNYFGGGLL